MSKVVGVTVGSPLSKEKIIELIKEHSGENLTAKEVSELLTAAQRELIGTSDDLAAKDTIKGAKAYAAEMYAGSNEYTANKVKAAKKEIIGFSDDEETANTINGAKNYAKKLFDSYDASEAVEAALTEAKESGEFNGADGQDGENGLSAYQIWLQQGNTGSEADFLESLKGADGASGKDGAKGSDGEDGKDGTSVTVSSVTESTADGGENVVTFSDGKTLTVKNGSKGSKGDKGDPGEKGEQGIQGEQGEKGADGAKGDKGDKGDSGVYVGSGEMPEGYYIQIDPEGDSSVDFLTEDDKAEITEQVQAVCVAKNQGASNVGKILVVGTDGNLTLADMPEGGASGDVVGVLDESNNILLSGNLADGTYTLKYEMEDGSYTTVGTLEVGEIEKPRTNFAGTLTVGRLSGSATGNIATDTTQGRVTDFVSVQNGDIVSVQGYDYSPATASVAITLMVFNSSKTKLIAPTKIQESNTEYTALQEQTTTGGTVKIVSDSVAYIRFSGVPSGAEEDIIVNIQRNGEWL